MTWMWLEKGGKLHEQVSSVVKADKALFQNRPNSYETFFALHIFLSTSSQQNDNKHTHTFWITVIKAYSIHLQTYLKMATREEYVPPSSTNPPAISTNDASSTFTPSTQYICGECAAKVILVKGSNIRCGECGHRILYKERTRRYPECFTSKLTNEDANRPTEWSNSRQGDKGLHSSNIQLLFAKQNPGPLTTTHDRKSKWAFHGIIILIDGRGITADV